MQKLAGKTAIVTGAGRGIGNAVARRFASEGARVILISRSPSSCGGAAEEINKEFPDSCKAYPCDVADYAAVQETMAAILKDFLQIDILVNNAGITRDSLMLRMKEEDWDAVLDTNLKSAFNTVKALQRVLMKSPAGRIINMSSVIGLVGNIGQANYAASKAGLIGFTKSLALAIRSAQSHVQRHCSRLHLHGNVQCHSRQSQGRNRQENTFERTRFRGRYRRPDGLPCL